MTSDVNKDYTAPIIPQDDGTLRIGGWNSDGDCDILPSDLVSKTRYALPGCTAARSDAERARDRVSVKEFLATGDGVTDDTDAIQSGIDALALVSPYGGTLYFPRGKYLISETLNIPACYGLIIEGESMEASCIEQQTDGADIFYMSLTGQPSGHRNGGFQNISLGYKYQQTKPEEGDPCRVIDAVGFNWFIHNVYVYKACRFLYGQVDSAGRNAPWGLRVDGLFCASQSGAIFYYDKNVGGVDNGFPNNSVRNVYFNPAGVTVSEPPFVLHNWTSMFMDSVEFNGVNNAGIISGSGCSGRISSIRSEVGTYTAEYVLLDMPNANIVIDYIELATLTLNMTEGALWILNNGGGAATSRYDVRIVHCKGNVFTSGKLFVFNSLYGARAKLGEIQSDDTTHTFSQRTADRDARDSMEYEQCSNGHITTAGDESVVLTDASAGTTNFATTLTEERTVRLPPLATTYQDLNLVRGSTYIVCRTADIPGNYALIIKDSTGTTTVATIPANNKGAVTMKWNFDKWVISSYWVGTSY